jgi:hypothetical protein
MKFLQVIPLLPTYLGVMILRLIATLMDTRKHAEHILKDVPYNSVVLFPESVDLRKKTVKEYSVKKNLFIIFNKDSHKNGKQYITMRRIDNGIEVWRVRKFKLWHTDTKDGFSASRAEPIVTIRGKTAAVFICYDMVTIGRENRLFALGEVFKKYKPEILLLPANWEFNFPLVEDIMKTAIKNIPSIQVALFSCTNTFALIIERNNIRKISKHGWIEINMG